MLLHPQRGARRSVDAPDTKIDMTPMIDVTFLIIVFFLCTLRFKSLEGRLGANLPRDVGVNDPSVAPVERPRLAVRVVAGGTLTRPDGAPYTCPFTGEVLIGRAGLAILPGPVLGPYVSGRFLSDPTLSSADKGPDAAP